MVHLVFTVQIISIHRKILKELNPEITDCYVYYIMYNLNWPWGGKWDFFLNGPKCESKSNIVLFRVLKNYEKLYQKLELKN